MDFLQAEAQFRQLDAQYKAGQISYDQYRDALIQLQVTEGSGAQWQIQELTGQWYTLSGGQWIPAQPPGNVSVNQPPLSFTQAEGQFAGLEAQYMSGQITMEYYRTVLAQLQVTDASQNVWQMQERTGAWYVLSQGQWVPATPSGAIAPPTIAPPQQIITPQSGYPPQYNLPRKKSPWGVIGIVGGGLLVMVLAVVGISALIKGGAGSIANTKTYDFKQQSTLTLNPGESQLVDDHGTTLQVAAEALPVEDSITQLTVYAAGGELEKVLSETYTLETPFYEVSLQGQNDGSGPAVLSFPAASPNSRLLMIIDMQAAILLDEAPQNGKLTTKAHLGPTDPGALYPDGENGQTHNVLYVVVTPKQTSFAPNSSIIMASNRLQQESFGKMCTPVSLKAMSIFQRCQSNEDGSVMVIYPSTDKMTHIDAYHAAEEIEAAVSTYLGMGYTNSYLDASSPILAVVSSSYKSPEYNFKNGVIYLPPDIPVKLNDERMSIRHEVGHWIQNRVYSMAIAKAVGAREWWLEVAAEVMVMDINPEYITSDINTYGKITLDDNMTFAFQSAPYEWPADFYVQSQLVMVNICDLGCPITRDDFVRAINKGLYPFNGNYEREMLTSNLEDYARYLLGFSPREANTNISLAGVQSQDEWGQIISISRTEGSLIKFNHNGDEPQIKEEKTQIGTNLIINAAVEKDGVYPLQITSGTGGKYTGLPMMLVVEPGVPFLYRLDGGAEINSDGSKEVKIGPLQAGTGVGVVRLVAFSKTGGQSFKAKIEPVNLDGTWVIIPSGALSNDIVCTGGDTDSEDGANPEGIAMAGATYFSFLSAMGEMTTDSSGQTLDWALVPERIPADVSASDFTFNASAITEIDGIRLQGQLDLPKPTDESGFLPGPGTGAYLNPLAGLMPPVQSVSHPVPIGMAVVVLLPAVGISLIPLSKKRQRLMIALAIGMMVITLAGCFGFAFYGTIKGDIKITKLEYKGGSGTSTWDYGSMPTGDPIWVFKDGTATFPIDFFIEVSVDDIEGNTTTSIEQCSGTATY
ncbi:MAG: hypothetical protein C0410_12545, partial [Anaerolinea sp.]|nr:hypothetical protein [Anaerolinea sp.]